MISVAQDKIYRLFNIGATGLVAAEFQGDVDVMPASWVCALDLVPAKVTAVIDKTHYTRKLVEQSGYFAIGLPGAGIVKETLYLGSVSKFDEADKIAKSGAKLIKVPDSPIPMVEGCVAWVVFKVIPEFHNEQRYDLFIGEAVAAWADSRVFTDGHWHFEAADDALRTLHYVAGGHFYRIGEAIHVA
ncbi:MAG: flavin reductase family protein [Burkholderiaceae bacterium]|nr:flavin reductase family protein [Burkholderiaceae bacterium]